MYPHTGTHSYSTSCLLAPAFIKQLHEEHMFAECISWAKHVPCRSSAHPRIPVGHSMLEVFTHKDDDEEEDELIS